MGTNDYILGLDLGANSCGWAVLDAQWNAAGERWDPVAIRRTGVRIFEAGVEGDLEAGKEDSRNLTRRTARSARRRLDRLARRLQRTYSLLEALGLLPRAHARDGLVRAERRDEALKLLDRQLLASWRKRLKTEGATSEQLAALPHTLPYLLRARGLDQPLEPFELGRALYHLAQRRGFKSNRKDIPKDEKEEGAVKEGIKALREAMVGTEARTFGEHFAVKTVFHSTTERIRNRYTARAMFEEEFDQLWTKQAEFSPALLTEDVRDAIRTAIFFQRPLKSAKHLVGRCELVPSARRAPIACLEFQRFRVLQKLNDLLVSVPDAADPRRVLVRGGTGLLSPEERTLLLRAFETELDKAGNLTLAKIKKLLKLPKGSVLNFEGGSEGEKSTLPGHRTVSKLRTIFGARWDEFTADDQQQAVHDLLSIRDEAVLTAVGTRRWGLDPESAKAFGALQLEPDYCMFSRKALRQLLPLMETGLPFATARKQAFGDPTPLQTDKLLPVKDRKLRMELRNPAVERALTELRKVVNALIREYGTPAHIRIEFAREFKKSKKQRQLADKQNRDNEKARDAARSRILAEAPGYGKLDPRLLKRSEILKMQLWEECEGTCPYTGKTIPLAALFGPAPTYDIEHIIPYSRSLDDSFLNKTLCHADENRRKGGRTPFEAYGSDEARYAEILNRVFRFKDRNGSRARKFERFQLEHAGDFTEGFTARQLNDTRYIARLARQYLGQLYGANAGGYDATGKMRITVGQGGVSAALRREWRLNAILGEDGEKVRSDHRHHAVDAIVVACTTPAIVQRFSHEAQANEQKVGRWWKGEFSHPLEGFNEQAAQSIAAIVVSHRVDRRVSGPLHEETNYAPPRVAPDGKTRTVVRKPVYGLKDTKDIVDPAVRAAVQRKLDEVGGDFKKLEHNWPALTTKDGEVVPIKKVRVWKSESPKPIGQGVKRRWVVSGSNHHMEILAVTDKKGQPKWEGVLVPMAEAYRRVSKGEPVVQRDHGPGREFVMSIAGGDTIEVGEPGGKQFLYRVRIVAEMLGKLTVRSVPVNEARLTKEIPTENWLRKSPDTLRRINCRKVEVDAIGNWRYAND